MAKIDTNVGHLVDMIERGELRPPEPHRGYVCPATRVRDVAPAQEEHRES